MQPFTTLAATAVPLPDANIDTDQIIPSRFLRKPRSAGYHNWLFHDLRVCADGSEISSFPLNQERYKSAAIMVAGDNFGCGFSREGAVWALMGRFRAVVAPSFGDIFFNNSLKNGFLPVMLARGEIAHLLQSATTDIAGRIAIDLDAQTVTAPDGATYRFAIDPFRKQCLLTGKDEIDLTLSYMPDIQAWESRAQTAMPWLVARSSSDHNIGTEP